MFQVLVFLYILILDILSKYQFTVFVVPVIREEGNLVWTIRALWCPEMYVCMPVIQSVYRSLSHPTNFRD